MGGDGCFAVAGEPWFEVTARRSTLSDLFTGAAAQ